MANCNRLHASEDAGSSAAWPEPGRASFSVAPHMGPRKIIARLTELHPDFEWPAPSTAGYILVAQT